MRARWQFLVSNTHGTVTSVETMMLFHMVIDSQFFKKNSLPHLEGLVRLTPPDSAINSFFSKGTVGDLKPPTSQKKSKNKKYP